MCTFLLRCQSFLCSWYLSMQFWILTAAFFDFVYLLRMLFAPPCGSDCVTWSGDKGPDELRLSREQREGASGRPIQTMWLWWRKCKIYARCADGVLILQTTSKGEHRVTAVLSWFVVLPSQSIKMKSFFFLLLVNRKIWLINKYAVITAQIGPFKCIYKTLL